MVFNERAILENKKPTKNVVYELEAQESVQLEVGNTNKKYPKENVSLGGASDEKKDKRKLKLNFRIIS